MDLVAARGTVGGSKNRIHGPLRQLGLPEVSSALRKRGVDFPYSWRLWTMTNAELAPADLMTAANVCQETLRPALNRDWSVQAGDLEWDCRRTLDHVVN